MSTRDDFSFQVKKALAERASFHCCFLSCGAVTIGPSDESNKATSNTGVACHITAASPGGRRYDPTLTVEQRCDISNGIWMCQSHSKLIDTDESRFTTKLLLSWKEIGEHIAKTMQERSCSYNEAVRLNDFSKLINQVQEIKQGSDENEIISDTIHDCGIVYAWGEKAAIEMRDYFIELTRNALTHGKATAVKFTVWENKATLEDNGDRFDSKSLASNSKQSGGIVTLKELLRNHDGRMMVTSKYENGVNVNTVAFLTDAKLIKEISPCSYEFISREAIKGARVDMTALATCNEIYVIIPRTICVSDIRVLQMCLSPLENDHRPITFVTNEISDLVQAIIFKSFPASSIVNLPRLPK